MWVDGGGHWSYIMKKSGLGGLGWVLQTDEGRGF